MCMAYVSSGYVCMYVCKRASRFRAGISRGEGEGLRYPCEWVMGIDQTTLEGTGLGDADEIILSVG